MQVQGCGIAGAFECGSQQTANVLSTVNINAMVSSLKHRGPDAQRIVSEPGINITSNAELTSVHCRCTSGPHEVVNLRFE